MQKTYNRINWENYPSDRTPLNETNLNKLDVGVNELDNRIITLDNTKFDKTEASQLIKNFELDKATGIITVTYLSGATATIDTMLEKLAVNFDFDKTSQKLVIVLDDGTVKEIDLTALITEYEFKSTDTVAFSVDADGNVSAIVKDGSIQERHLRPNYLADIKVESAKAEASAIRAEQAEINAVTSADNATQFVNEAMRQLEAGELKGDRGSVIHSGVRVYLATGSNPVGIISNFTDSVLVGDYYINTNNGDYFICTKVENDRSYWDFLINLKGIEGKRGSKIYIAEDDVFFPPQNIQSQAYTGDVIINSTTGDMYEVISDSHTAGNVFDFKLVGNIKGPEGNVGESAVTGVKGDAETTYRTGNVNITAENIGLGNVDNTADKDKNVKHAESATQDGNGNNIPDTYATKQSLIDNFNNYGHWGSAFFNSNDVNTWIKAGIYCTIPGQDYNLPSQTDGWCTILVIAGNIASNRITQICWGWNDASCTLYKRGTGNSGANWSDWVAIVDEGNITRCITPNKIGAVESRKITELTDFNQFQETGMFYINFLGASNQPVYAHGLLIVNFDIGTPFQIFIPDIVNAIVKRNWHGTYWSDWYNAIDTLYNKGTITTNSQILNTATAIEASTSNDNIVGAKGLKEYVGKNSYMLSPKNVTAGNIIYISVENYTAYLCVVVVVPSNSERAKLEYSKNSDGKWFLINKETNTDRGSEVNTPALPFTTEIRFTVSSDVIYAIESAF